MTLLLKNKHSLKIDDFNFKCCVGKKGITSFKKEGDFKTPKGIFGIENLYYRKDKIKKPKTILKCIEITNSMGWCNDINQPKKYNRLINTKENIKHEKLKRKDYKYDLLIPIKYNLNLTKNYRPTAGCIALRKKDFLIMLKLLKKNTKIKIN
jgi:L,D-peptidoglycan transpeptidase YkuD (ErfK/YbiS/YcfS/YnhG family)